MIISASKYEKYNFEVHQKGSSSSSSIMWRIKKVKKLNTSIAESYIFF